jgi:hypothetical protein
MEKGGPDGAALWLKSAIQTVGLPAAGATATVAATAATTTAAATEAAAGATATAAAAAEAAGATTAATAAAEAAGAGLTGTGFVDNDGASAVLLAVHSRDGRVRLSVVGHLDEAEAAGATGLAIHDDLSGGDFTVGLEHRSEFGVVGAEREISDVQLLHCCLRSCPRELLKSNPVLASGEIQRRLSWESPATGQTFHLQAGV